MSKNPVPYGHDCTWQVTVTMPQHGTVKCQAYIGASSADAVLAEVEKRGWTMVPGFKPINQGVEE